MQTLTLAIPQRFELGRLAGAAFPAAAITTALFLVMLALIREDAVELVESGHILPDVIMVQPAPPAVEPPAQPERPLDPVDAPTTQLPLESVDMESGLSYANPTGGLTLDPVDINPSETGSVIVAYLKVQPIYPSRALSRGIEGYVDLAFDITAAGNTTNIRVIEAEPDGVFEKAAIAALRKWKYKVPVEDGVPRGQNDMMSRISFNIDSQ